MSGLTYDPESASHTYTDEIGDGLDIEVTTRADGRPALALRPHAGVSVFLDLDHVPEFCAVLMAKALEACRSAEALPTTAPSDAVRAAMACKCVVLRRRPGHPLLAVRHPPHSPGRRPRHPRPLPGAPRRPRRRLTIRWPGGSSAAQATPRPTPPSSTTDHDLQDASVRMTMGQTRKDTGPQRAAKARRAERTRCPRCNTASALLSRVDKVDGAVTGIAVECRRRAKGCTYATYTDYTTEPPTRTEAPPPDPAPVDPRRWWVVSGDGMVNHYYPAASGRSALARFRADLIEGMRGGNCTKAQAALKVRALALCVQRGPLTTAQACADQTSWTWAEAIYETARVQALAPLGPATREQAVGQLGEEHTDRLETQVRAHYYPPGPRADTGPNPDQNGVQ